MCLYPRLIKNKKYQENKKNGGVIPAVSDTRVLAIPVGCGNCMECRKQKARDWQVRMHEEIKHTKNGHMVTLTFNEKELIKLQNKKEHKELKGYTLENATATMAVRRFLERWRAKNKKSVRHWLITELGHEGTERIHLHGIIFTDKPEEIEKRWKYGHVWIGQYVNEKTINYIIKYVNKVDTDHPNYKSKILSSKGIGNQYTKSEQAKNNKYRKGKTIETYKTRQGLKLALPIYYRNKIYTDREKEQLWLEKLDKEERYINGIKFDISKNKRSYLIRLKQEQQRNHRLGYGNSIKNWDKINYENEQRQLLKEQREKKVQKMDKPKKHTKQDKD